MFNISYITYYYFIHFYAPHEIDEQVGKDRTEG